jgi:hypothetical protein
MPKPIRLALERMLALVLSLLIPATGRRRRPPGCPGTLTAPLRTRTGLRLLIHRTAPPSLPGNRTTARTRRTEVPPLLDDSAPLIRPYLLALERQQRQQERRTALVLALDGIDIGPWVIHGHRIGTPVAPVAVSLGVAA